MSKSKSSQASTVTNTNINNVLDGDAIKKAFDFADGIAEEAFDSSNQVVESNTEVVKEALNANTHVIDEAFDSNSALTQAALERLQEQNNKSLDAIAGLQGQQASNNFELLKGIQSTIDASNSGGATDVLEVQKVALVVFAIAAVLIFLFSNRKG